MEEKEFQTKVLDKVGAVKSAVEAQNTEIKSVQTKQDALVANYDQLDKDTKKAFEELTTVKNENKSIGDALVAVKKVVTALKHEERMAFGNPIERISRNEEKRTRLNAAVRLAMDANGDMRRVSDPLIKALGEDASPGSTLIDDALAQDIYDTLAMYGVWNTFGVRRLGTKTTKFPVKTVRPIANFILTEGGTISDDTNKAGTSVSLEVEAIAVLLNVSLQLLMDSDFDVTADVMNDFAEAFSYRLDWAALQADGTSDATDGAMTGVFAGGTASTAATGNTTMETLDLEDFTKCLTTVDAGVLTRMCRWWMHPQLLVRALHVKDLNGRPIFLTATEAPTPGGIGSILGYPVIAAQAAPSTNAAGAKVAVFGDPEAMVVGVRQDYMFEASDQHKWDALQRSFRGWGRAGTKIRRALGLAVLTTAAS